jgi:hypothetical protein
MIREAIESRENVLIWSVAFLFILLLELNGVQ